MAVITLTTGWRDDFYVAAVKGILLSAVPSVQVVDLSHQAPAFNTGILYAAYMVKHSYAYFPKGTVHIISVASEYSNSAPFVAAYNNGHYFTGTDNGIFDLLFDSVPEAVVRIEKFKDDASPNYPAISVFAPAAVHLVNGGDIAELGSAYADYQRMGTVLATVDESQITGTIIHINAFGNVITNITRDDFERVGKGRPFEIMVQSTRYKINRINRYFHETSRGELLAVFNISGYLEIAINKGKVASLLQLSLDSNIIVKFFIQK
ncbi:MAG: SAM-dependent chlorinase/fluorinase [Bacteroidales bacterium]|jgi:S-adenosylmethionine hydrolase|nr:SAM-dependent chlorinase/fluorinase [Bacteroidales bacterium]